MVKGFKDFKNFNKIRYKGGEVGGHNFLLIIINIIVYNFRIKNYSMFTRIFMSISILIAYFIVLNIIVKFVYKEFQIIYRMIENKNDIWKESSDIWEYSKLDKIDKVKIKLINYGFLTFLILDLVSIYFFKNSIIIEFFSIIIQYFLYSLTTAR